MYKLIIASWLFLLLAAPLQAQTQWFNPLEDGHAHYIQNQAWDEDGGNYNRLPARAKGKIRDDVWNLSRESAGLSIRFLTDSKKIQVRYQVRGGYSMPHMPATGVSGVDLYARVGGKSLVCYGSYSFADTIRYNYTIDKDISSDAKKEYELYLPLYNGVKWLEIGIEEGKELAFIPARKDRCVVVYGTSIAQGACASRPGMAWSNIVSRELDIPVVNLGFSGNGRLEKEVIDFICEVNAWAYVIDCMANLQDRPAEEVKTLAIKAVKQIREKTDAPILLVEHAGYSNAPTNQQMDNSYKTPNKGLRAAYNELKQQHTENLYYLSNEEIGFHPDSWVDYVHPSDYGMVQQAKAVERKLKEIQKKVKAPK